MKVLVATRQTQGQRANDFCWADEGEIVGPYGIECTCESIDGRCGCRRSLSGIDTHKSTTTAMVAEVEGDFQAISDRVARGIESAGWIAAERQAARFLATVLPVASRYPVGTVIERRGARLRPRGV